MNLMYLKYLNLQNLYLPNIKSILYAEPIILLHLITIEFNYVQKLIYDYYIKRIF